MAMLIPKREERTEIRKSPPIIFGLIGFFVVCVFCLAAAFLFDKAEAAAANPPSIITYQGKLLISGSSATTTQSIIFVVYNAVSGGTALYSAGGTTSSPTAISVTPSAGLFSVNLGDTGTNALDPSIFQSNADLYLEVRVGAETLSPRKRISASPFAFNSKYLSGYIASTNTTTVAYVPVSDASGNFSFNVVTSTAFNATGNVNISNSGALLINGNNVSDYFITTAGTNGQLWSSDGSGAGAWLATSTLGLQGTDVGGFAAGSIIFASSTGKLAQDNSNFYWDDTNNKLGVGTSSPVAKLDVWGNLNVATGTTPALYVNTATGNVGVGTSTPGNKFTVAGNLDIGDDGYLSLNGTNYSQYFITSAGTSGQLWSSDGSGAGAWLTTSTLGLQGSDVGGFTTGSVVFANTNGKLTQDNSKLFWDNSADHLGIGTTTPGSELTVVGEVTVRSSEDGITVFDPVTGFLTYVNDGFTASDSGSTKIAFSLDQESYVNTGYNFGVGTSSPIAKLDVWGNLNVATGTTPALFVNTATGKVGIGNNSPTSKLHVTGDGNITSNLTVGGDLTMTSGGITLGGVYRTTWPTGGGTSGNLWVTSSPVLMYPDMSGNYAVVINEAATTTNSVFEVNGASHFRSDVTLASGAKLGVSTTTPAYALSVVGDVDITGTYRILGVDYGQYFIDGQGTSGQLWSSDGSGRGAWLTTSTLGLVGADVGGFTAGSIIFASSTGKLTQDNSNFYWDDTNNKLGIGTSSPASQLTIRGVVGQTPLTIASSTGGNILAVNQDHSVTFTNISGSTLSINNLPGGTTPYLQTNSGNIIISGASGIVYWYDSSAYIKRVTQLGGTSLHIDSQASITFGRDSVINGGMTLLGNTSVGGQKIFFYGTTTPVVDKQFQIWSTNNTAASSSFSVLGSSADSYASLFEIKANGYIGIGTSTPWTNLTVSGTIDIAGTSSYLAINGTNYSQYFINSAGTLGQLWSSDGTGAGTWLTTSTLGLPTGSGANGQLAFWNATQNLTGSTTLYWNDTIGRLGVNTTTPSVTLDVWGNLNVATGTTPALYVNTATGNVGVGTSTPGSKLTVAGNLDIGASGYLSLNGSNVSQYFITSAGTLGQLWSSDGSGAGTWLTTSTLGLLGSDIGGFTAGSVVFASTSGKLTEDNSNLFWDNTNNRLGVNTNTPSVALDVWGNLNVATSSVPTLFANTAMGAVGINTTTPASQLTIRGVVGQTPLTIASSTGGNILVVNQNQSVTFSNIEGGTLTIKGMPGGGGIPWLDSSSDSLAIDAGILYFYDGGGYIQRATIFGSSGMRTDAQSAIVWGKDGVTKAGIALGANTTIGGQTAFFFGTTTPKIDERFAIYAGGTNVNSTTLAVYDTNSSPLLFVKDNGFVGVGTSTPGFKLDVWGNLNVATGTTPALFVNTATGNVGVGTSTPGSKLTVAGNLDIGASGYLSLNGTNYSQFFINSAGTTGQLWSSDGSGAGTWTNTSTLGLKGSDVGGFTDGSVIFAGASGALSEDNDHFHYDSDAYLGLGTDNLTNNITISNTLKCCSVSVGFIQGSAPYAMGVTELGDKFLFATGTAIDATTGGNIMALNGVNGHVGIGTTSPEFKLDIDSDGGIIARGTYGSGDTLTTSGAGTRLIWYPRKAAFRAGYVNGTQWDDANVGNYSAVLGGENNTATGTYSAVVGGSNNIVASSRSVILGGAGNSISGGHSSVILGGEGNTIAIDGTILGYASILLSTNSNVNTGGSSMVLGGDNNTVTGHRSASIYSGQSVVSGGWSTVVGGKFVTSSGEFSAVFGSYDSVASGDYSLIVGGFTNTASGSKSAVVGGSSNVASGGTSAVVGGRLNTASDTDSIVLGGYLNTVSGVQSAVLAGNRNNVSGDDAVILGGYGNVASGKYGFVTGYYSTSSAQQAMAFGNKMTVSGHFSFGVNVGDAAATLSTAHTIALIGGDVGIGTTTPGTTLHVYQTTDGNTATIQDSDGTCVLNPEASGTGSWACSSDIALKKDILDLSGGLTTILALRPVNYTVRVNDESGTGFIAQEVETVLPNLVSVLPDGYKGLAAGGMMPYVVQAIKELNTKMEQMNTSTNLGVSGGSSGQTISYIDADLNLNNFSIINVKSIQGASGKWAIDENGLLVAKISTSLGDKSVYNMSSENAEITLSGTGTLQMGEARITFASDTAEMVDATQPIKVSVTLTSLEAKGVAVVEKNEGGFLVKELSGGTSGASFDWIAIVKRRLLPEPAAAAEEPPLDSGLPTPPDSGGTGDVPPSPLQGEGEGEVAPTSTTETPTSTEPIPPAEPPASEPTPPVEPPALELPPAEPPAEIIVQ